MTSIPRLQITFHNAQEFRLFWVKYVTGFDPSAHCARCLIGKYSSLFPYGPPRQQHVAGELQEHPGQYVYLCGYTGVWKKNLHIVGTPDPQAYIEYSDHRLDLVLEGMRPVPIRPADNPPDLPEEFLTCRCWQFGWHAFPHAARQLELFPKPPTRQPTARKRSRRTRDRTA
ncbi:MAG: hypothetical protein SFX18_15830 [Pirellulales bacterium]|nr:hypothetical protein [Pirellulales bacterium]